jgi:palmitoyl protein thioesterase
VKKLVLFIHGLGGTADGTWLRFPELMRQDAELARQYDVMAIDYASGAFGPKPGLPTAAAILKTEIENRYPASAYSDIALIAHSQGGLVARSYIAERINSSQPLRVSRLLTFATPHQGSGFATLLKWVPFASQQTRDLDPNSEFMRDLAVAWGQAKADRRVLTKYVVAADDAIVGQVSAMGAWSPGYEVVSGAGHLKVVKPETSDNSPFLIARNFLLEPGLAPGGVEADYTAPLLSRPSLPSNDRTRFIFSARVLPLIGRDAEKEILANFLGSAEQPFRWMLMHGSGGVGKSRLALEVCLAVRDEWHAGFLRDREADPVWGKWQPLMPTLIVIDPAAYDKERTGKVLRALAGREPASGAARLAAPVRVLLIERAGDGDWLKQIMGDETERAQVDLARAADLNLNPIDDPWPIFEFVLNAANKPLPDKNETLAAFDAIDSERRPLFAYFTADAIARGVDIRHFDADRLLDAVIEHGRNAYWKPAGAKEEDERLLAVATMAGGVAIDALDGVAEKLLPSWDIDRHPPIFLAMTGREPDKDIAPLEPDIVGEHFVLSRLAQRNLSEANRARLCELAWQLNAQGMEQFVLRVMHDFRSVNPRATRALLDDMHRVAAKRNEAALWELWSEAAAVSFGGDLTSLIHNSVIFGPPGGHDYSPVAGGFFYENPLVTRDPAAALALLEDQRREAAERDETPLWKTWTYAALGLMHEVASRDPTAALVLLQDVLGVTAAKSDGESLDLWRPYVGNIVNAAMEGWLADMRDTAKARYDAGAWEQWAKAALILMHGFRSFIPAPIAARALLAEMRAVAAGRNEAALWESWVLGCIILMDALQSRDLDAAHALLEDMRGEAVKRDDATIWHAWAAAGGNLLTGLAPGDPAAARVLLDDMHRVAEDRDDAALWESWALASFNLIVGLGSRDPAVSRALVNDMLETMEKHPGPVGGWQTKVLHLVFHVAFTVTKDLGLQDPDAARAFSAETLGIPESMLKMMKFGD